MPIYSTASSEYPSKYKNPKSSFSGLVLVEGVLCPTHERLSRYLDQEVDLRLGWRGKLFHCTTIDLRGQSGLSWPG